MTKQANNNNKNKKLKRHIYRLELGLLNYVLQYTIYIQQF